MICFHNYVHKGKRDVGLFIKNLFRFFSGIRMQKLNFLAVKTEAL